MVPDFVLEAVELPVVDTFGNAQLFFVLLLIGASLDCQGNCARLTGPLLFVVVGRNMAVIKELSRVGGARHRLSI